MLCSVIYGFKRLSMLCVILISGNLLTFSATGFQQLDFWVHNETMTAIAKPKAKPGQVVSDSQNAMLVRGVRV